MNTLGKSKHPLFIKSQIAGGSRTSWTGHAGAGCQFTKIVRLHWFSEQWIYFQNNTFIFDTTITKRQSSERQLKRKNRDITGKNEMTITCIYLYTVQLLMNESLDW